MYIAIFIDSSNPEFRIIAGNIAYEQGRKEQAQVFYEQAFNQIMKISTLPLTITEAIIDSSSLRIWLLKLCSRISLPCFLRASDDVM
jgi:hypothetical protein